MTSMHTVRTLIDSAHGGGYTLPAELLDAYNTFKTISALEAPQPAAIDLNAIAAQMVDQVAAGRTVDLVALGRQATDERDEVQRVARTQALLRTAAEMAANRVTALAYDLTERIITEHLRPALNQVHDETRDAAAALRGHSLDPHALIQAPAKARNAYLKLPELVNRRRTIYTARRWANAIGGRAITHDVTGMFGEFENPLAFHPTWRPGSGAQFPMIPAPDEPTARLLWVVEEGAKGQPWLPTAAEQDAAWLNVHGEQLDRQRRGAALAQQAGSRGPVRV